MAVSMHHGQSMKTMASVSISMKKIILVPTNHTMLLENKPIFLVLIGMMIIMAWYAMRLTIIKQGKKIWIWGLSRQGMIWEKILTDTDGQYAEIQSGRLFNQNAQNSSFTPFKHLSFTPHGTDTWKEYWYPVNKTNGIVVAGEFAALNVKIENGFFKMVLFAGSIF